MGHWALGMGSTPHRPKIHFIIPFQVSDIKSLENEPIEPLTQRSITEFKTLVLATGVVLVTYRIVRYISGEQPVDSLRSSIWKLIDNRWKMIFHQGTVISSSS